ncbi:hypothetical protein GS399_19995 [Pedobacter sp. HMF7647]|uniref:Uncharacterized protein n=1 Tax=Hufsiella arboris TaxID=2695275 RepID=A0A7K1YF79_9SPHI|nr:hypothetical protein [Hufsiella arboris]MXV53255.1 hypothetical protein [Hufsiella arboris]
MMLNELEEDQNRFRDMNMYDDHQNGFFHLVWMRIRAVFDALIPGRRKRREAGMKVIYKKKGGSRKAPDS